MLKKLTAVFAAVFLVSSVFLAEQAPAPLTGNWDGTLTFMKDGKVADTDPAYLVLKQDGKTVTGTAGPNAERQFPLTKVKFDLAKDAKEVTSLAFEVDAGSLVIWFDLKHVNGVLKGTATGERGGDKQVATVEFKLVK